MNECVFLPFGLLDTCVEVRVGVCGCLCVLLRERLGLGVSGSEVHEQLSGGRKRGPGAFEERRELNVFDG